MGTEKSICTYCGAEIKKNAKACPECGSDELTGWSELTYLDGIDFPDQDYEEIKNNEFGEIKKLKGRTHTVTAIVLLIIITIAIVGSLIKF